MIKIARSHCAVNLDDFDQNNRDLYSSNVRDFQNNKKISSKIIKTITDKPSVFYKYHNGITFSAKKIEKLQGLKFKITNPQIINGCQTVNSIYQEFKTDLNNTNLINASILCRVYELTDPSSVERVCEANNTQESGRQSPSPVRDEALPLSPRSPGVPFPPVRAPAG